MSCGWLERELLEVELMIRGTKTDFIEEVDVS